MMTDERNDTGQTPNGLHVDALWGAVCGFLSKVDQPVTVKEKNVTETNF